MVTAVRWEAQVEKAFFLSCIGRDLQDGSQDKHVGNDDGQHSACQIKSHKDRKQHDVDVSVGAGEGKNWRNVTEKVIDGIALAEDSENVKPVCTEAFMEPMMYEPATNWMQTLRDMTVGE